MGEKVFAGARGGSPLEAGTTQTRGMRSGLVAVLLCVAAVHANDTHEIVPLDDTAELTGQDPKVVSYTLQASAVKNIRQDDNLGESAGIEEGSNDYCARANKG